MLISRFIPMIEECNSQALASTAWALAVLQVSNEPIMEAIGRNVSTDVKPRDLASLVWSFASLSVQHPSLRRTLREYGIGRSAQFSAIDLASIAWSLALLQWHGDQMMEEIALAAGQQVSRLPVQALSNLVWSFATS